MKNFNLATFELLEATGLNWTVNKEPLFSQDQKPTESFGMFRNDSGAWLGTVGNRYAPMQNFELAETIVQATDQLDLKTQRGGQLSGGSKVYLQAELPDSFIGNSNVKRWITGLNSHDGSSSIGFGSSSTVVVCQNTFYKAYKDLSKFRHTQSAQERIKAAVADLRKALQLDNDLMDNFKRMADVPLQDEMIEAVIRRVFKVDPNASSEKVSTRKFNIVNQFTGSLQTEIGLEGKTLWGLFNGITRFTNHVAAPQEAEKKADFLMTGSGFQMAGAGYDEIMKWVEANQAELHFISK